MLLSQVFCFLLFSFTTTSQNTLSPDVARQNEVISPDESVLYILSDLQPNSHYEIRVSYPATSPTDFSFEWSNEDLVQQVGKELLNIEKVMFTTDQNSQISNKRPTKEGLFAIRLRAKYSGVSHIPNANKREVTYDIVLETLFYNVPFDAFKIGIFVALGFILFLSLVFPQLSHIPAFRELIRDDKNS